MKLTTSDGRSITISHILGIGRNYAAHAHEQGLEAPEHPKVFSKNIASVIGDGDDIVIPPSLGIRRLAGTRRTLRRSWR